MLLNFKHILQAQCYMSVFLGRLGVPNWIDHPWTRLSVILRSPHGVMCAIARPLKP
jgi:hypothetical protein